MMERETVGGLLILAGLAGVCWLVANVTGDLEAHREFVACRAASAQAKSDSIAVALRPECKRWLFPESVK